MEVESQIEFQSRTSSKTSVGIVQRFYVGLFVPSPKASRLNHVGMRGDEPSDIAQQIVSKNLVFVIV